MLLDLLHQHFPPSAQARLILASQSPRRLELFRTNLGLTNVRVVPSTFAEDLDKTAYATPAEYVMATSREKAKEVFARCAKDADLVISADSVVVLQQCILEKPTSREHAIEMLSSLSGSTHHVITAVTLMRHGASPADAPITDCFYESTEVTFAALPRDLIEAYVDTNEPMDKAGGYGIQGLAAQFVTRLHGCYFNVMGFPIHAFCQHARPFLEAIGARARSTSS